MRYKLKTGSFAWVIHRVSGVVLTLYIFAHLYVLSHLKDPKQFTAMMAMMDNPLVKLGELGLLGVVAAHTLNGLRLVMLDLGVSTKLQKPLFWAATAACAVCLVYGGWQFMGGAHR